MAQIQSSDCNLSKNVWVYGCHDNIIGCTWVRMSACEFLMSAELGPRGGGAADHNARWLNKQPLANHWNLIQNDRVDSGYPQQTIKLAL